MISLEVIIVRGRDSISMLKRINRVIQLILS